MSDNIYNRRENAVKPPVDRSVLTKEPLPSGNRTFPGRLTSENTPSSPLPIFHKKPRAAKQILKLLHPDSQAILNGRYVRGNPLSGGINQYHQVEPGFKPVPE
jgi:hypothetical protein